MANILDILNEIGTAIYGRDVRQAIIDAIRQCYEDGKAGVNDLQARTLIEAVMAVNEQQAAEIETLTARVEELEEGGSGGSSETSTTSVPTFLVESGTATFENVGANKTATQSISFTETFTEAPTVLAIKVFRQGANTFYSQVTAQPIQNSITTTGFTLAIGNKYTQAVSPSVLWVAFQPTTVEVETEITTVDGMSEADVRALLAPITATLDSLKIGYDGTEYDTAGASLREQINALHVLIGDEPGTAISASAISYGESNVETALDTAKQQLESITDAQQVYPINLLNFNDPDFATGKLSASTGLVASSPTARTTGFIPVEEGKTYNWIYGAKIAISQVMSRICAYDSSKNYLSSYTQDSARGFTVPSDSGIAYVRFSGSGTYLDSTYRNIMFTEGFPSAYSEYFEPYYESMIKNSALDAEYIRSLNPDRTEGFSVYTEWENGKYNGSWNFAEDVQSIISDYIHVGKKIVVTAPTGYTVKVYKFSIDGTRLTTYPDKVSGTAEITEEDADLIRITCIGSTPADISDPNTVGLKVGLVRYGTAKGFKTVMSAHPNVQDVNVSNVMPQYLSLVAVKERNISGEIPVTVGYLYRTVTAPYKLYYAQGKPENIKYLCDWDTSLAGATHNTPIWYCFGITDEGDIICVHRGEIESTTSERVRDNPIVYPHTDYAHPVLVELSGEKPTSWISNSGDFAEAGHFWFGEYIRAGHTQAHVWDVVAPYTSASNWTISKTYDRDTDPSDISSMEPGKIEHIHHVSRDPFSGILYVTTGDHWTEARIDYLQNGSWGVLRAGDEEVCRQLNFIYTPTYVYWGSDAFSAYDPETETLVGGAHKFFRAKRDANGFIDLDTIESYAIPYRAASVATYHTCYVREPECILILDRQDRSASYEELPFHVWDIRGERLELASQFKMAKGNNIAQYLGFRCECCQHYPNFYDSALSVGFSLYPNSIDVCGNPRPDIITSQGGNTTVDDKNANSVNSMTVTVKPLEG